jgi:4-hydroxy-tetrahydrodipicolinate reductase
VASSLSSYNGTAQFLPSSVKGRWQNERIGGACTMSDMRIAVLGAAGRMGQALTQALLATSGCEIAGGLEAAGSPAIGRDLGEIAGLDPIGVQVTDDPHALFAHIEGVLDFTLPHATTELVALSAQSRIVHVIGTTGFTEDQLAKIDAAARHATIVKAGNMSMGVNLMAALTERVATILGPEFDIEILEMHHRHKRDAPSGTSLMLGEAAAKGRAVALADKAVRTRDGDTGPRTEGDIGFAALRGGDVVGEHSVIFAGPAERFQLTHIASDRGIFARGAVRAALWARGRGPGLYSMLDVLGL